MYNSASDGRPWQRKSERYKRVIRNGYQVAFSSDQELKV